MSLIRRTAQKTAKASRLAKLAGMGTRELRAICIKELGLKEIKYSDTPNAPIYFLEGPVSEYLAKRQQQ